MLEIAALDAAIVEAWGKEVQDLISIVEGKRIILRVIDEAIGGTPLR